MRPKSSFRIEVHRTAPLRTTWKSQNAAKCKNEGISTEQIIMKRSDMKVNNIGDAVPAHAIGAISNLQCLRSMSGWLGLCPSDVRLL